MKKAKLCVGLFVLFMFLILGTTAYAATVGQQLTAPEAGWERYDDRDGKIVYIGDKWTTNAGSNKWNNINTFIQQGTSSQDILNHKIKFKFYGSKIGLIQTRYPDYSENLIYKIDGVEVGNFNGKGTELYQIIFFEKLDLGLKIHEVEVYSGDGKRFDFDAIDIDDIGYLIAQVGSRLTAPEAGWKRYDDADSKIIYEGTWTTWIHANSYGGTEYYATNPTANNKIKFKFYGTKLRLIAIKADNRCDSVSIKIDNVSETFSTKDNRNSNNQYIIPLCFC